ncbi:MAG TPA: FtsX-like permease family protein [Anaerolineales bacterium]|jgi:putative ABC transport system permease protein
MFTRWRKVWMDFWSNKTRSLLMVSTILVGVFSIGLVNNMARMMNHDMDSDFLSSNPSEVKISAYPLNDDWVRWMRDIPGVGDVEGRNNLIAKWVTPAGQSTNIQIAAIKSIDSLRVDQVKPAQPGGLLPSLGRQDIIFDRSAEMLGLQPGQDIEIEMPGGDKRSLHFIGYVHDATAFPYSMTAVITGYVTLETGEWLGGGKNYNQLLVSVSENPTDRTHVSDVAKLITDRMEKNGVAVYSVNMNNPGHHFAWQVTQGVIFILDLFGWMTVVLSAFLIVNTIVALMSQQTRQIGVMKAIGADAGQIFPMYVALLLGFGGLAFLVSVPLSAWAAASLLKFLAVFLNFEKGPTQIYPDVIWMQVLVSFLTPLLAALVPVINGLRIPVREAISSYGLGGSSQKAAEPKESRWAFISRPVLLSLRNAFRRKARVSLTIFTLVLGGAIFIGVFNLWASFDQVMQDIQGYFLADINVSLTQTYPFKTVSDVARTVPGVQSVEGWLTYGGNLLSLDPEKEDEITFVAPPSDSTLIQPMMVKGRWLAPGDRNVIVIGNQLQHIRPDLQIGDWVTIKLDGKKTRWQIIGFYRLPGNSPPLIYTNYEYLSHLVGLPNQVYELRVITYDHDAASQAAISENLQAQFKPRKIGIAFAQTAGVWYQSQKSQTDVLVYNMLVMAALIAVVGGLGLTSTMSLNVMERTREIGVMRAIGAGDGDIQKIVITEGVVIGLLSWALGVVFSIPFTYLLDYGVGVSIFQSPLDAVFSWTGSLAWLLGMIVIAALSSLAPALRASRLAVRETLVYE